METTIKIVIVLLAVTIVSISSSGLKQTTIVSSLEIKDLEKKMTGDCSSQDLVLSDTEPQVSLSHIFCGQIKDGNQAQGYHSTYLTKRLPIKNKPAMACAEMDRNDENRKKYPYEAKIVTVRRKKDFYIQKLSPVNTFFPDDWTHTDIVNLLLGIVKICWGQKELPQKPSSYLTTFKVIEVTRIDDRSNMDKIALPNAFMDFWPFEKYGIRIHFNEGRINSAYPMKLATKSDCTISLRRTVSTEN